MKVALTLVVVAVAIAVTSAALTCMHDENKCAEDECCIRVSNLIGRCKKLKDVDDRCEMKPKTLLLKKHVHLVMCPCASGMECISKDGIIGKVFGTCQPSSEE